MNTIEKTAEPILNGRSILPKIIASALPALNSPNSMIPWSETSLDSGKPSIARRIFQAGPQPRSSKPLDWRPSGRVCHFTLPGPPARINSDKGCCEKNTFFADCGTDYTSASPGVNVKFTGEDEDVQKHLKFRCINHGFLFHE
ncbi:MAG TPA: hypothetical protein PL166_08340 [Candidatus Contendobacter sp.]|nr:hypothetical protein [Candidatus Contendobacter sp.]HRD49594.1 hypothetical protein [Candidatus Contendobacter sp.]